MELQCQMRDRPPLQLPGELVCRVLRYLDQRQRLGSCSLVCKAWRTAAAAATSYVWNFKPLSVLQVESLGRWLLQPGAASLTQLVVQDRYAFAEGPFGFKVLQLPAAQLQQLRRLDLTGYHLLVQQSEACGLQQPQLPEAAHRCVSSSSSSSSRGAGSRQALPGLTSLTSLELSNVAVPGPVGLGGLSALTRLQELQLNRIRLAGKGHARMQMNALCQHQQQQLEQDILLGLHSLTQLTRLVLEDFLLPKTAVAPFSCLQQLQDLTLPGISYISSTLQQLPLSLTKLKLECGAEQEARSSLCRDLAALTNLRHLDVCSYDEHDEAPGMLPEFCSSMQQLRVQKLHGVLSKDALPALVRVLPGLSRLESLTVTNSIGEVEPLPANDVAGYSALLPLSPHITYIELSWGFQDYPALLHDDCGQHVFATGHQLPQLKRLMLGVHQEYKPFDYTSADEYTSGVSDKDWCLGEGSISRLVGCCPGLEQLWLAGMVGPGVDMRALLQLTALSELCVGGDVVSDDVASDVLAQLSSLQRLGVFCAEQFTDRGLLALTGLKHLTRLAVGGCGISEEVETSYGGFCGTHVVELRQQGSLPPVWLQLLSRCVCSESCGKLALEQLTEVQAGAHGLEQRLAAAEAALAAKDKHTQAAQQQLAAAAARATGLEQRLAAAEAALAAAPGRANDLEQRLAAAEAKLAARDAQAQPEATQQQLAAAAMHATEQ